MFYYAAWSSGFLAHLFVCFARSGFPICHIDVVVGRRRVVTEAYPGPFY